MAFGETGDDETAFWQCVVFEITRDAANVGHPIEIIDKFEIVWTVHADRLEVVGHTRRTVNDADVFSGAVLARCLVDDVAYLREPGRLEAVAPDRLEFRGQDERRLAIQNIRGCEIHRTFLLPSQTCATPLLAGVEVEASG